MDKILLVFVCRYLSRSILLLFFLFFITFSFAQVKFFASTNSRTIGKNDFLQVQFNVENAANVETIAPPVFKDFAVVSGPNQQSSMSNINGNIKQIVSIAFVLQPLSTGNFTIASAIAKADGKEYRSKSITIKVTNATSGRSGNSSLSPFGNITLDYPTAPVTHQFDDYILKKGENVAEKVKRNLFLKIDVSKKSCYVGEPIIATYKLYTRLKSESNVLKAPSFNGFSVSELEMPDNYSLRTEKYNGREYNVYILRKVQLYPLQSGKLHLEPVEVNNRVTFLKAEYAGKRNGDFFYDLLRDFANENTPGGSTEQQIVTITGDTLSVNVKPLPDANKPPSFKGAVGNFKIAATLEKNKITTEDAGSLKVIISGSGNIQLVNAPGILWPEGIEGFESKASENIDKLSVPLMGDKVFIYPFTVNSAGKKTIPAITFSYFDINTQSYKTINTKPLSFSVTKGNGNTQKAFKNVNNSNPENNWLDSIDRNLIYFIAALVLFCVLAILFVKNKKNKNEMISSVGDLHPTFSIKEKKSFNSYVPDPVEEPSFIIPKNVLADAEENLRSVDNGQFYKKLNVGLHKYLSEILKVPVEDLTRKKINERMDKCNVGVGTALLVNSLLKDIEVNLYAPVSSEMQKQELYERASEVVALLDKQVC